MDLYQVISRLYLSDNIVMTSRSQKMLGLLALFATSLLGTLAIPPIDDNRIMEVMLPMRDGVRLHTWIVFPKDYPDSGAKYTAIVDRSPYG